MNAARDGAELAASREVSVLRLYVMRAAYALIVVGLGVMIWPKIVVHTPSWPLANSVVSCLLGAVSILSLLGLRYPLQMLPVLLFELTWKSLWLIAVALPLWRAGQLSGSAMESVADCVFGVVVTVVAIPWPYVWSRYWKQPAARWR